MKFTNKKVLVCGMARSGISAAILLEGLGAIVTIQDIKDEDALSAITKKLTDKGITLYLEKNPDDIIEEQDLIIISPGIPCDLPFVEKIKELDKPLWGEMELAYRLCPCPIIGITGTNGKTTTTAVMGEIMQEYNPKSQIVGNIGIPFTEKVEGLSSDEYVIAEISSFQLETIHQFKAHIAAILNIQPDHLNRHKTLENYISIKKRIFENQDPDDFLILNYDDETCRSMAKETKGKSIFFSRLKTLEEGVYLEGSNIHVKLFGIDENIFDTKELLLLGNHNVENALAAVAMALCAGVCIDIIVSKLKTFEGVEHRIEFVADIEDVSYYNDSKATNVDSAIKSVEAMTRPVVLIAGGQDKDLDFSGWVKGFEGKVKHVIVIGDTADRIIKNCIAYNFNNFDKVNTLKDAVMLAAGKAQKGDCVLLAPACASYDMFDNYEQRGNMFKKFVRELR